MRSMALHFTDVVHQTEEQPLRIHFGAPSEGEATQSMRVPEVGKDGFHDAESAAVLIATFVGVDLALHHRLISRRLAG